MCQAALRRIDPIEKIKAYKALLGVYQWLGRKGALIDALNDLSRVGWSMRSPPAISPMLAQRLGLSRVPGVVVGSNPEEAEERSSSGGRGGYGDRDGGRGGFSGGRGGGGFGRGGDRGGFSRGGFGGRDVGRGGFNRGGDRGGFNRGGDRGDARSSDPFS